MTNSVMERDLPAVEAHDVSSPEMRATSDTNHPTMGAAASQLHPRESHVASDERRKLSGDIRVSQTFDSDSSQDEEDQRESLRLEDWETGRAEQVDSSSLPSSSTSTRHEKICSAAESLTSQPAEPSKLLEHVAYISCFSLLGTVLRIFMARLFGLDCELKGSPDAIHDFMSPFSDRICITASGKTGATGGALFTDLPANMLGCFIAGLIAPNNTERRLPWFRHDHALQQNQVLHAALKVGLCGSLTTFSSWNTQMIVMMDGEATVLGPQVSAALFGYIIGIMCPLASFVFGTHVHGWWIMMHQELRGEGQRECAPWHSRARQFCCHGWERIMTAAALKVVPFVSAALLLGAFVYAGYVDNIMFYRKLWFSAALAPLGALLRWWLIRYNDSKGYWSLLEFIPWGTVMANLLGCLCSILAEAFYTKYFALSQDEYQVSNSFLPLALLSIETGFCGSLSTVSTFVAELVGMHPVSKSYLYGIGTILVAMAISSAVYVPIIRS